MSGYLHRPPLATTAPWQATFMGTVPLDVVAAVAPHLPARALAAQRASASCYVALVSARQPEPPALWPGQDTFTDATGTELGLHAPDSGGMWVNHELGLGASVITAADRLRCNSSTANSAYYHSVPLPAADYDVSAVVHCFTNPATSEQVGVLGRLAMLTGDAYLARYRAAQGFQLFRFIANAATQLGTTYARVLGAGEDARLTLRMAGTAISLLVDGVVRVGPITDSSTTAAGFAGVFLGSNTTADTDSTGSHLDNWNVQLSDPPIATTLPDRAPRQRSSSWMTSPGAAGLEDAPVNPVLPHRAMPARLSAAHYTQSVVAPAIPPEAPFAVPSPALLVTAPPRAGVSAYSVTVGPVPADAAGFVGPRGGKRTSNYLYRREPQIASYAIMVPSPRDLGGAVQDPVHTVLMPDQARVNWVPGQGAFMGSRLLDVTDARAPVVPHRAPGAMRAAAQAYSLLTSAMPRDAGLAQPVVAPEYPDLARAPLRTARLAYATTVPAPRDAGIILVAPSVPPSRPDFIPSRIAQAPYSLIVSAPRDAGTEPTSICLPDRSPGPRLPLANYAIFDLGPVDAGIVLVSPPVAPVRPDFIAPRPGQAPYSLVVAAPRDAGLLADTSIPLPRLPERASGPRLPLASYAITTASPRDAGAQPMPVRWPERASAPRRAGAAAYVTDMPPLSPPDAGLAQPIVFPVLPSAARGPQWAAQSSYTALVSPPPLTPGDLAVFPDPFGSTLAIATDPFGSTVTATVDPFGSTVKLKGN